MLKLIGISIHISDSVDSISTCTIDSTPLSINSEQCAKPKTSTKDSLIKKKLRHKLNNYRQKLFRLRKKINKSNIRSTVATNKKIETIGNAISEFVQGPQYDLIMSQLKNAKKHARGKRWTYKDKSLALSLFHSSPKTYRLLQSILALSSVKTLKSIMKNISLYPGFNENILTALGKKLKNTPENNKVVALAIDEMSLKEGLSYDSSRDLIEGFSEMPLYLW